MHTQIPSSPLNTVQWHSQHGPVDYLAAVKTMEARVRAIREGSQPQQVWLVEHPSLYTAGSSAKPADLLEKELFPVYQTGRGGQFTYHGPGQRVIYIMLDLQKLYAPAVPDLRNFVSRIEHWLIDVLADFDIDAFTRQGRTGVWVQNHGNEAKIAALGVRVSRGVSYHGASINLCPDLNHYRGIVPCGIGEYGVTSMQALGKEISMQRLDSALYLHFSRHFGIQPLLEHK